MSIISDIDQGEPVEPEQVENFRARYWELEERLTYGLREVGELDTRTPAERLVTEVRGVAHDFRRAARSARRDNLCQHELDRARESLYKAEKTLDSLEEELEE